MKIDNSTGRRWRMPLRTILGISWWLAPMCWALVLLCAAGGPVLGQEGTATAINEGTATAINEDRTAQRELARVGVQAIRMADVRLQLGRPSTADLKLTEAALQQTVELIAIQRQALETLRRLGLGATTEEVESWVREQESSTSEGAGADEVAAQAAKSFGVSKNVYLDHVGFRLAWKRYLAKHLTESNLVKHYERQPQRFDGTQFRVWVLSSVVPAGESKSRAETTERMRNARPKLEGLTTQEVADFAQDGDMIFVPPRWIRGLGALDHALIDAVLQATVGEIAGPVQTASGVHLLGVAEVKRGDQELESVKDEVRMHMLYFLIRYLASQSSDRLPLVAADE